MAASFFMAALDELVPPRWIAEKWPLANLRFVGREPST